MTRQDLMLPDADIGTSRFMPRITLVHMMSTVAVKRILPGMMLLLLVLLGLFTVEAAAEHNFVADTGQQKFYDMSGQEIDDPVAGQPLSGQDAHYLGLQPAYQHNNNLTVTAQASGLLWMQADDGIARTWQQAVDYCACLTLADETDWRLPTRAELDSIVDYGRSYPAINPVFSCQASFYWSSASYAGDPIYAWGIFFNDGGDHWLDKKNKYYVRCVRTHL